MIPQPLLENTNRIKSFLLSQYFYDGFKITLGVILPAIVLYFMGYPVVAVTTSLGALFASIPDNPGPPHHKRNGVLAAVGLNFLMAIIIGFTNFSTGILAIEIFVFTFVFSLISVYGVRASAVGTSVLLTMIITMDQQLTWDQTLINAFAMLAGGVWYTIFSLSLNSIFPFRTAEQILGECMQSVADYLELRASFYSKKPDIGKQIKKLLDKQVDINAEFDHVREILFKTRKLIKDPSPDGNRLIISFVDLVDLYERIMESYQNYYDLHEKFGNSYLLPKFEKCIKILADDLRVLGTSIHNNEIIPYKSKASEHIDELKNDLEIEYKLNPEIEVLNKIWKSIFRINQRIQLIYEYQISPQSVSEERLKGFEIFAPEQSFKWEKLRNNLSLRSSMFRHSIRLSVCCLIAFLIARYLIMGNYSYWILLTLLVILKPAYSQTKKRNYERIIGTILGGALGVVILHFIDDPTILFWLLVLFILASYSFTRIRYVVSVFFMTPYVLILFDFVSEENTLSLVEERVIDTFIGAGLAAVASFLILPNWEAYNLKKMKSDLVSRLIDYLLSAANYKEGDYENIHTYKWARKEVNISVSNLTSALQRMLNEPKSKQKLVNETNRFIVLNNFAISLTASIISEIREHGGLTENQASFIETSIQNLQNTLNLLENKELPTPTIAYTPIIDIENAHDKMFITLAKTSKDIFVLSKEF